MASLTLPSVATAFGGMVGTTPVRFVLHFLVPTPNMTSASASRLVLASWNGEMLITGETAPLTPINVTMTAGYSLSLPIPADYPAPAPAGTTLVIDSVRVLADQPQHVYDVDGNKLLLTETYIEQITDPVSGTSSSDVNLYGGVREALSVLAGKRVLRQLTPTPGTWDSYETVLFPQTDVSQSIWGGGNGDNVLIRYVETLDKVQTYTVRYTPKYASVLPFSNTSDPRAPATPVRARLDPAPAPPGTPYASCAVVMQAGTYTFLGVGSDLLYTFPGSEGFTVLPLPADVYDYKASSSSLALFPAAPLAWATPGALSVCAVSDSRLLLTILDASGLDMWVMEYVVGLSLDLAVAPMPRYQYSNHPFTPLSTKDYLSDTDQRQDGADFRSPAVKVPVLGWRTDVGQVSAACAFSADGAWSLITWVGVGSNGTVALVQAMYNHASALLTPGNLPDEQRTWYYEVGAGAAIGQLALGFVATVAPDEAGVDPRNAVVAVAVGDGVLATDFAAGQTLDGVLLRAQDRILLAGQANLVENGLYVVTAGAPSRAEDLPVGATAHARAVAVSEARGAESAGAVYACTAPEGTSEVGTNSLVWAHIPDLPTTVAASPVGEVTLPARQQQLLQLLVVPYSPARASVLSTFVVGLEGIELPDGTLITPRTVNAPQWYAGEDSVYMNSSNDWQVSLEESIVELRATAWGQDTRLASSHVALDAGDNRLNETVRARMTPSAATASIDLSMLTKTQGRVLSTTIDAASAQAGTRSVALVLATAVDLVGDGVTLWRNPSLNELWVRAASATSNGEHWSLDGVGSLDDLSIILQGSNLVRIQYPSAIRASPEALEFFLSMLEGLAVLVANGTRAAWQYGGSRVLSDAEGGGERPRSLPVQHLGIAASAATDVQPNGDMSFALQTLITLPLSGYGVVPLFGLKHGTEFMEVSLVNHKLMTPAVQVKTDTFEVMMRLPLPKRIGYFYNYGGVLLLDTGFTQYPAAPSGPSETTAALRVTSAGSPGGALLSTYHTFGTPIVTVVPSLPTPAFQGALIFTPVTVQGSSIAPRISVTWRSAISWNFSGTPAVPLGGWKVWVQSSMLQVTSTGSLQPRFIVTEPFVIESIEPDGFEASMTFNIPSSNPASLLNQWVHTLQIFTNLPAPQTTINFSILPAALDVTQSPGDVNTFQRMQQFTPTWRQIAATFPRTRSFTFLNDPESEVSGLVGPVPRALNTSLAWGFELNMNPLGPVDMMLGAALLPAKENADSESLVTIWLENLHPSGTNWNASLHVQITMQDPATGDKEAQEHVFPISGPKGNVGLVVATNLQVVADHSGGGAPTYYAAQLDMIYRDDFDTYAYETHLLTFLPGQEPISTEHAQFAFMGYKPDYSLALSVPPAYNGMQTTAIFLRALDQDVTTEAIMLDLLAPIYSSISVADVHALGLSQAPTDFGDYVLYLMPDAVNPSGDSLRVYNQALLQSAQSPAALENALFTDPRELQDTLEVHRSRSFQSTGHCQMLVNQQTCDVVYWTIRPHTTTLTSELSVGDFSGNEFSDYRTLLSELRLMPGTRGIQQLQGLYRNAGVDAGGSNAAYYSLSSVNVTGGRWSDIGQADGDDLIFSVGVTAPQLPPVLDGTPDPYVNSGRVTVADPALMLLGAPARHTLLMEPSLEVHSGSSLQQLVVPASGPSLPAVVTQLTDARIVGQAQRRFIRQRLQDSRLLGYIEGPPPCPNENMCNQFERFHYVFPGKMYTRLHKEVVTQQLASNSRYESDGTITDLTSGFKIKNTFNSDGVLALVGAGVDFKFKFSSHSEQKDVTTTADLSQTNDRDHRSNDVTEYMCYMSGFMELADIAAPGADRPALGLMYSVRNEGAMFIEARVMDEFAVVYQGAFIRRTYEPPAGTTGDSNVIRLTQSFPLNPAYRKVGSLDGTIGLDSTLNKPWVPPDVRYRFTPEMYLQGAKNSYYRPEQLAQLDARVKEDRARTNDGTVDVVALSQSSGYSVQIGRNRSITGNTQVQSGSSAVLLDTSREETNDFGLTVSGGIGGMFYGYGVTVNLSQEVTFVDGSVVSATRHKNVETSLTTENRVDPLVLDDSDVMWLQGVSAPSGTANGVKVPLDAALRAQLPAFELANLRYYEDVLHYDCVGVQSPLGVVLARERAGGVLSTLPRQGKVKTYAYRTFVLSQHEDNYAEFFANVADPLWVRTDPIAQQLQKVNDTLVDRVAHVTTFVDRHVPDALVPGADDAKTAPARAEAVVYCGAVTGALPAPLTAVGWASLGLDEPNSFGLALAYMSQRPEIVGFVLRREQAVGAVLASAAYGLPLPAGPPVPGDDRNYLFLREVHFQSWNEQHTALEEATYVGAGAPGSSFIRSNRSLRTLTAQESDFTSASCSGPYSWILAALEPTESMLEPTSRIMWYYYAATQRALREQFANYQRLLSQGLAPLRAVSAPPPPPTPDVVALAISPALQMVITVTPDDPLPPDTWIGIKAKGTPLARGSWVFFAYVYHQPGAPHISQPPSDSTQVVDLLVGDLVTLLPVQGVYEARMFSETEAVIGNTVDFNARGSNSTIATFDPLRDEPNVNATLSVVVRRINSVQFELDVQQIDMGLTTAVHAEVREEGASTVSLLAGALSGSGSVTLATLEGDTPTGDAFGLPPNYYRVVLVDTGGGVLGDAVVVYSAMATA